MEKFMYKMDKIPNFHVLLQNTSKSKINSCEFVFLLFKKVETMHKVKSNTFKNVNYKNFLINGKIDV